MKPNPDTTIPIHITPHHLSLTPALSQFVRKNIGKLPRFAGDAVAADIVLRRHHGTAEGKSFSASARLALPGRDVHATVTHGDLYTAITRLTRKLARRSLKRKARRERASQDPSRRSVRSERAAMLRDPLARWSELTASRHLQDALTPPSEADSSVRGPTPMIGRQTANELVERSTSSNPAHGISFRYLECLAGHSRTRAGAFDAFLRAAPLLPVEYTA